MVASSLITDMVPPILASESCEKALIWMDEFKVAHLPVVKGTEYVGLVSDDMILDANDTDIPVGELNLVAHRPFVFEHQHVYEVMKLMSDLNITVIPVLDRQENYLGLTTTQHIMSAITNMASIEQGGAVIVISMNENDYSLAHLAQIIEGNDAKILSSYVTSSSDSTEIEVTLKLNKQEIGGILQTLYRYEFNIKETYAGNKFEENMQDRFDALMRFLDL
ncbi:MAG: CBS domain-containing protein [Flavobacteriales bacterium]|nr:CBS domain-containing protein [Flavobacteriales bacterium]MCB9198311.1 CBS domain-containing protein [Flavobacteriales bacterium]